MWGYGWLTLGGSAFIFVFADLIRAALRKYSGWQILLFASLSCGGLAMLCALRAVNGWVQGWQVDQLLDIEPALTTVSTWALCLGIALELLVLLLNLRRENAWKEAADDGER